LEIGGLVARAIIIFITITNIIAVGVLLMQNCSKVGDLLLVFILSFEVAQVGSRRA